VRVADRVERDRGRDPTRYDLLVDRFEVAVVVGAEQAQLEIAYANYKYIQERAIASGMTTVVSSSATVFPLRVPAVNADAGAYGAVEVLIMNYSSAVGYKHIHARTTSPSRTTLELCAGYLLGRWANIAPITSLTLTPRYGTFFLAGGANEPQLIVNLYALLGYDFS